jgi:hypothetical protein
VAVWREDLQSQDALEKEIKAVGITSMEVRKQKVTGRWQDVQ